MSKNTRIVRRFWRGSDVTCILPEVLAFSMDGYPKSKDRTLLGAYSAHVIQGTSQVWATTLKDIDVLKTAGIDLVGDPREPALFHATWIEEVMKKAPGNFVSPTEIPVCDLLLDERIVSSGVDGIQVKIVAYKLDFTDPKKDNGVEYVTVPTDEINMLMSMVGTLTITLSMAGRSFVEPNGIFADNREVLDIAARLKAMLGDRG